MRRSDLELCLLGRALERDGRGGAARDHLRHLVEVAGADEALKTHVFSHGMKRAALEYAADSEYQVVVWVVRGGYNPTIRVTSKQIAACPYRSRPRWLRGSSSAAHELPAGMHFHHFNMIVAAKAGGAMVATRVLLEKSRADTPSLPLA